MDSTVTKFREVWHPLLQRNVWFPDEMTFHETVSVTVRSVELNPALPAGSFTPVMDENTTLRDQTKPIDLRQATRTDLVIPKPRDVSKLEPLENAIRAFPETTSISGLTFLGLGVVLLAGAAVAHLWLGRT